MTPKSQWPDGSSGPKMMEFSTECPSCGNLDSGHKRGCSDPTPCVEFVPVLPASGFDPAEALATNGPEGPLSQRGKLTDRPLSLAPPTADRLKNCFGIGFCVRKSGLAFVLGKRPSVTRLYQRPCRIAEVCIGVPKWNRHLRSVLSVGDRKHTSYHGGQR